ncbi:HORMA domain-containing protein 1 isoform X2 [Cyprinodon tularosa]|nr:HORMA domain-containing protein 1 isoform X2 [Cyprinodon tularosa]
MASVQRVRPSQAIQLLPNEVVSEQQSVAAVKKLLAIAVSSITYLRGIFPGRAYGTKYLDDQKVMILKEDHNCPGTSHILKWMAGCFDAIEKKYLRVVIMSLFTDPSNPQRVTECYKFRIQYAPEGTNVDFESKTNEKFSMMSVGTTKKASILLVRKLYTLMQNLGPLPENVCLNMKLAYYDDVTPQDYQPPGFQEAEETTLVFEQEPVTLTFGKVETPYHCLKFDMATEKHRLEQVKEGVSVNKKWILEIEDPINLTQSPDLKLVEESENFTTDMDNTEIQLCIDKEEEEEKESGEDVPEETNVTMKRKQSTRIKEKMVSQYDLVSSQEPSAPGTIKKRRFSEPKSDY